MKNHLKEMSKKLKEQETDTYYTQGFVLDSMEDFPISAPIHMLSETKGYVVNKKNQRKEITITDTFLIDYFKSLHCVMPNILGYFLGHLQNKIAFPIDSVNEQKQNKYSTRLLVELNKKMPLYIVGETLTFNKEKNTLNFTEGSKEKDLFLWMDKEEKERISEILTNDCKLKVLTTTLNDAFVTQCLVLSLKK